MTLPRDPLHWTDDDRHDVEERIAMRLQGSTRPLTRAEEAEVRAWAEEDVRASRRAWAEVQRG